MRRYLLPLVLVAMLPATGRAVTSGEIVARSKAGVSDQVLVAMIDRDQTILAIDGDGVVALRGAGLSEAVVMAMLRSGRQSPSTTPVAESLGLTRSTSVQPAEPLLTIVGHGPEGPGASARDERLYIVSVPVFIPVGRESAVYPRRERPHEGEAASGSPIVTGRFLSDPTHRFLNSTFVPRDAR
jgi:hypothetical protein